MLARITAGAGLALVATGPVPAADRRPAVRPAVPAAVIEAEHHRMEVIRQARPAVVAVLDRAGTGGGSAVVISPDGYALTNFHVAQPIGPALKCGLPDGRLYDAVLVGIDPTGDVALIKLLGRDDFPHARLGDSDQLQPGDWVLVMGNPFLLAYDFQPSVTYGIVSGTHRYQYPSGTLLEYTDCIQTDAAINPGNSGGPLFDARGQLVGIVGRASFEKRGRVNVGVGYAISINQIKLFLGQLKSGRIVDHATLGATVARGAEDHVVVDDILESCDAYRRGLRYDDQIIRFAGRDITSPNQLKNILGIYPRGWRVALTYRHEGVRHRCLVRLEGLHREGELDKLMRRGPHRHGGIPRRPALPPNRGSKKPSPGPSLAPPGTPATIMPTAVAKWYESRPGFANYLFNQRNQQRVWNAFMARGDFAATGTAWTLQGHLQQGGQVRIELDSTIGTVLLPAGQWKADFKMAPAVGGSPPGSGGLLAALHAWQRLLRVGPRRFGDVYYLGTEPSRTNPKLFDVLVGTWGNVETRFLFDPDSGNLAAIESSLDDSGDPCEVVFGDFRQVDGRTVPHRLEVYHGDSLFAVIHVDAFRTN